MDDKDQAAFNIKIGLLGDSAVGKTSLGTRYVDDSFSKDYKPTIGIDIYYKKFEFKESMGRISLWDMSGFKRFSSLRNKYLKGLNGGIVIFDSTRAFSLDGNILPWIYELLEIQVRGSIPLAIIGNKSDLDAVQKVETSKIIEDIKDQFNLAAIKYFTTSAKTGSNVTEAFDWLIEQSIIAAGGDELL
jgi:small GTP-binding protein